MTTIINGIEFTNFGTHRISEGMELITVYPCPPDLVQRVLNGEFKGVYLNPTAPCGDEFFGVLGTEDQYKRLYKSQKEALIGEKMIQKFGFHNDVPIEEWNAYKAQVESSYQDWWEV